jgi:hypothetical protein
MNGDDGSILWILICGVLLYWLVMIGLIARLRARHADIWRSLGSPSFFSPRIDSHSKLTVFMLSFRYVQTNDAVLVAIGFLAVIVFAATLLLFLFVFISGL